jgi:large subunit ribosomal protein L24
MKANIKKNDQVMVMVGREKGKTGRVVRVASSKGFIEKTNMVKRHTKPSASNRAGGIVEKEAPLYISKVMLVCPKCSQPSRVGRKRLEDDSRVRFCKKCNEQIDG